MATSKPRITVTLDDQSYRVLKAISDCSGQPMSKFVAELLDGARPTLERMAVTFQKIKQAQEQERGKFLTAIDDAQSVLEPYVMETVGQFDLFMTRIDDAIDRGAASAATVTNAASSPLTNRGATLVQAKNRKASGGKASRPISADEVLKKTVVKKTPKCGSKIGVKKGAGKGVENAV